MALLLLAGCTASRTVTEDDLQFQNLLGDPIPAAAFDDKVVVLDFWATWCGPCQRSMPHFQEAYEQFKNHPEVTFLAVN